MESARHWPDPGESTTRRDVRAAAADLRWLSGHLTAVGKQREQSSLAEEDEALARLAAQQAAALLRMAEFLERAVGPFKV